MAELAVSDLPVEQRPQESAAAAASVRLLDGLRLDHGPIEDLAAFLLMADTALSDMGITMYRSSISELVRVCEMHPKSWGWFAPMLDVRIAPIDPTTSYSIIGLDRQGEVAVVQGGKLLDTGDRSVQEMADDHSLYYGVPHDPAPHELQCRVSAPMASTLKGRLHYSGGLWVDPRHRGRGLPAITERVSRALGLGWWGTSYAFSFVSESLTASPLNSLTGFKNVQPSYSIFKDGAETYKGSLIWMDAESVAADLKEFSLTGFAKIDAGVIYGSRKNTAAAQ
jgi:hypothetical protein